ncbi:hypothetical protein [Streptomyces sp. NPDC051561]|uniref:hypothetical protein n=1 Tax=Streptomyces sp. NPDC051561 TaxID=3365658 RepID=UPI0037A4D3DE
MIRQAEADHGSRPDLLTTAERAELVQLLKETAELRRTNEILKAASVVPPSCNEIQRLFITLVSQPLHDAAHRLGWSAKTASHPDPPRYTPHTQAADQR